MAIRVSLVALRPHAEREVNQLIGWLFVISVIEIHTFLVTLVRQFDFSVPENGMTIKKLKIPAVSPIVVGEEHKGPQMPLKTTVIGIE
jgi:hypothetical protein